jgi:hypothetical protein
MVPILLSHEEALDLIHDLEAVGCQFFACEGPEAPIEDMKTCRICEWVIILTRRLQ